MTTNTAEKHSLVRDEMQEIAAFAKQAVMAKAYLYPFKGIHFFLAQKTFRSPLLKHVLPTIALSASVTGVMFTVAYVPQAAVLALVNGPVAIVHAALLVLNESAVIVLAISRLWWMNKACADSFDAVLIETDNTSLVAHGREIKPAAAGTSGESDAMARLGPILKAPYDREGVLRSVLQYAILLPINMIPIIGTPLFLVLQARRIGVWNHARYFQLKGFSREQRGEFIWQNQGAYISFGLSCVALNLIPMGNLIFAVTNCMGAALWAAKIEHAGHGISKPQEDGILQPKEEPPLFQGDI